MEKRQRALRGAYGIILTPFDDCGRVNYTLLEKHIDELCGTGIDGLVVCGSTSEFVFLSAEENIGVMECAAAVTAGRKPLICGATAADSRGVERYLRRIRELPAAYALVAPPYYFTYSDEELVAFYREISGEGVKLIAYQIPAFTNNISQPVYEALLDMPGICGLKNSSGNIKQIMHELDARDRRRPDFSILSGTDDALVPSLVAGCDGSFTALGSLLPELVLLVYRALERGDLSGALGVQYDILPLLALADQPSFPIGYKLLAQARNIDMGPLRQNISGAGRTEFAGLCKTFRQMLGGLSEKYGMELLGPIHNRERKGEPIDETASYIGKIADDTGVCFPA